MSAAKQRVQTTPGDVMPLMLGQACGVLYHGWKQLLKLLVLKQLRENKTPHLIQLIFETADPRGSAETDNNVTPWVLADGPDVKDAVVCAMMNQVKRALGTGKRTIDGDLFIYALFKRPGASLFFTVNVKKLAAVKTAEDLETELEMLGDYACSVPGSWHAQRFVCLDTQIQQCIIGMNPQLHEDLSAPDILMQRLQKRAKKHDMGSDSYVCFLIFDDEFKSSAVTDTTTSDSTMADGKDVKVVDDGKKPPVDLKKAVQENFGVVIGLILGHKVTKGQNPRLVVHHMYLPQRVLKDLKPLQKQLQLYLTDYGLKSVDHAKPTKAMTKAGSCQCSETYDKFYKGFNHGQFWSGCAPLKRDADVVEKKVA